MSGDSQAMAQVKTVAEKTHALFSAGQAKDWHSAP
jgi:hypothetical protein